MRGATKERINSLCEQLREETDEQKVLALLADLRSELHFFVEQLRSDLISVDAKRT